MKYIVMAISAWLTLYGCSSNKQKNVNLMDSSVAEQDEKWAPAAPDTQSMKRLKRVEIITNFGRLEVALFDCTPKHRDNFLKLVKSGFYNGTLFHRIISDFMVQGGDPRSRGAEIKTVLGEGGPGYNIPAELSDTLYHFRGALAAAREGDDVNPKKESSGSQFYIVQGKKWNKGDWKNILKDRAFEMFQSNPENISYQMRFESYQKKNNEVAMAQLRMELETAVGKISDSLYNSMPHRVKQLYATWGGAPFLDNNYTVFGFLISGYDALDKMSKVETLRKKTEDRPATDVKILSARVLE